MAIVIVLCLAACAPMDSKPSTKVKIEGLRIENQTAMWVSAARLLVYATGGFVSCGNIPPGSMCSTGFPETEYAGNPVEVTWSQAGRIHSTGEFEIAIPDSLDADKPVMVKVVITGPGSAGAALIQKP
jgi:hypothetical protein